MDTKAFEAQAKDELRFFRRLPWEKMTIWTIFLLLIYALREFFDIIIVTFVLSYIGKNVVQKICGWLGAFGRKGWARQIIVLLVFLFFVAGLFGLGSSLLPTIYGQGRSIVERVKELVAMPASPNGDQAPGVRPTSPPVPDGPTETGTPGGGNADAGKEPTDDSPAKGGSGGEKAMEADAPGGRNAEAGKEPTDDSPTKDDSGDEEATRSEAPKNLKELLILRLRAAIGEERYDRWLKDQPIDQQIDALLSKAAQQIPRATALAGQWVQAVLTFSIHFLLSVVFSFLIVWDLPKLEHRTIKISPGRFHDFCREILPSVLTFSSVMGRAFQAQTVIALFNTVLTYLGLWFLGIESRYFLSVIVFFCSYIPVLGVFLSTVPMSIVALVQHQGGFGLMLEAILMVTILHLIEGYLLNPMIMGERFEMNPIVVIVILLVAKHFFGVWGLLLGVPVCHYLFHYAIQGHEEPSVRDSGIWKSLYPEESGRPDTEGGESATAES